MSSKSSEVIGGCVLAIVAALTVPFSVLINALVLMQLWVWFVIPTFGVAPLSIGIAAGMSLVIQFFLKDVTKTEIKLDEVKSVEGKIATLYGAIIYTAIAWLAMGWLVQWLFPIVTTNAR